MKFSHQVDHDQHRLLTTFTGEISFHDAAAHIEQREKLGALGYDQLIDFSHAIIAMTNGELKRLAHVMKQKAEAGSPGRTALLAVGDLNFGISRMYATFAEPENVFQVFRSRREAEQWLGWTGDAEMSHALAEQKSGASTGVRSPPSCLLPLLT